MTSNTNASQFGSYDEWVDRDAYDGNGDKIGSISEIYYDDKSQRPEWVAVKTGMFGSKSSFVPISGATTYRDGDDEHLQVQYTKDQIKDAPNVEDNGTLTPEEEQRLYSHYGFDWKGQQPYETKGKVTDRLDKDYPYRRFDTERKDWSDTEARHEEYETVPVHTTAQVEVPVDTQVRLRKYQTQSTRNVTVPVTETEDHVEVADVDTTTTKGKRK